MRILNRAAIVIVLLGATVPRASATHTLPQFQIASGYCRTAEKAMKVGNLKKARESLGKALALWPNLPAAHMGLGHLALSERRFEDALNEYRLAKDFYQDLATALLALQVESYSDAKYEVVLLQDSLRAQARLAPSPLRLNRLEAAIERLQDLRPPGGSSAEEAPGTIDFYIGNALFHLRRVEEAVASWTACVRKTRELPAAYQNLAVGYWMLGRLQDAQASLDAAERLGFKVSPDLRAEIERSATRDTARPAN